MSSHNRDVSSSLLSRRRMLQGGLAGLAAAPLLPELFTSAAMAAEAKAKYKIGTCRLNLAQAKQAGLDGVEIGVGGAADTLQVAEPAVREQYKKEMKETGLVISSFMMGLLNSYPLASDPRGPAWLDQSIDAAADLGAKVILVAFFGKGSLLQGDQVKQDDVDVVVKRVKAAAPKAQKAGVILGLENTLSAKQNAEILDRIGHESVRIYYDVGNSTGMGYDVPAEIRLLKDKIAIFHFKDGPNYLGEGKVNFPPIGEAIKEIGYQGWIVLETSAPSKDPVADAKKNADFIRKLMGMAP